MPVIEAPAGSEDRAVSNSPYLGLRTSPCLLPAVLSDDAFCLTPAALDETEVLADPDPDPDGPRVACILAVLQVSVLLSSAMDAVPMAYYPDAATKWNFSESMIGVAMAAGYFPVVVGGSWAATLSRRLGHRSAIVTGLSAGATSTQ